MRNLIKYYLRRMNHRRIEKALNRFFTSELRRMNEILNTDKKEVTK